MKREELARYARMPEESHARLMLAARSVEEEKMMKKKVSVALVIALILVALVACALAATVLFSGEADAIARAKQAVMREYGLTAEALGCFDTEVARKDEEWAVILTGYAWEAPQLGIYRVRLSPGKSPVVNWSHDDIDPALWQDGGLDAPAWGQAQIMERLRLDALEENRPSMTTNLTNEEQTALFPMIQGVFEPLHGPIVYRYQRIAPDAQDITREEAIAIARRLIHTTYGLPEAAIAGFEPSVAFVRIWSELWGWGERQYAVTLQRPVDDALPAPRDGAFTVHIASPSGDALQSYWHVEKANRTLPEGRLDAYAHAVEEFFREDALSVRSASEKAEIVARVREAGLETLITPNLPYAMPGADDLPEDEAIRRANEALEAEYGLGAAHLSLFDRSVSLLETEVGRVYEILYTPRARMYSDNAYWEALVQPCIGAYAVSLDARTGAVCQTEWRLDADRVRVVNEKGQFDQIPEIPAAELNKIVDLWETTEAIWARYPAGTYPQDLSLEDGAAYDASFRDAGFLQGFPRGMPREGDLSYDEAWDIAKAGILLEMPHAADALETATVSGSYTLANPEAPAWSFMVYFVQDGIEIHYHVMVNADTGDIRLLEIGTSGHG